MKHLTIILLLMSSTVFAQKIGVRVGGNVNKPLNAKYMPFYQAGIYFEDKQGERTTSEVGVYYNSQRIADKDNSNAFDYIYVSTLFKYHIGSLYVGGGVQIGMNVSKRKEDVVLTPAIGYQITNKVSISMRHNKSAIDGREWSMISIGYIL